MNSRGLVAVQPTLELPNHPGVFAFGDIIDWPEQKQLGKAPGQIGVVSANVQSFLAGSKPAKLYKSPPEMIVIPIGKVCDSSSCVAPSNVSYHTDRGISIHGHPMGNRARRLGSSYPEGQGSLRINGQEEFGIHLVILLHSVAHQLSRVRVAPSFLSCSLPLKPHRTLHR